MRKFKIIGFIFIASILTCCGQPKEIKTECNTVEAIDGKDGVGIESIIKTSSNGNVDTYTITFTDNTISTFTITNGKDGEQGIQGETGNDGYTPKVSIGKNGNRIIDGVDSGIRAEGIQGEQGEKGDKGNGIIKIELTKSNHNIDTYTIYFDDGTTTTFNVTNGVNGDQGLQGETGENGKSAFDIFKEYYPDYEGDEKQRIDEVINGKFNKVNITFDTNGGVIDGPAAIQINKGEAIGDDLPAPKKKGKRFLGWYTGWGVNDVKIDKTTVINSDLIIIAKWDLYHIEFLDFEGDVFYSTDVFHGEKVKKPEEEPTDIRDGSSFYSFYKWDFDFNECVYSDLKINSLWKPSKGTAIKTVTFGSYPQSFVGEDYIVEKLNNLCNGISGSIIEYDFSRDGVCEKYFCEKKDESSEPSFFIFEPIEWEIILKSYNSYCVVSKLVLDWQSWDLSKEKTIIGEVPFNHMLPLYYFNNYKSSALRKWLNNDFLNIAFNETERSKIKKFYVDNSASSTYYETNENFCANTIDNIFLLSLSETINLNFNFVTTATNFARYKSGYSSHYPYAGRWWTRSPAENSSYTGFLIDEKGYYWRYVVDGTYGIRPALQFEF